MAAGVSRADENIALDVEPFGLQGGLGLRLTGELDLATAGRLREALEEAHDRGQKTVVLDLSELRFIDSSGLHELVVAFNRQRAAGGDVILRAPTDQTRRVLEIVGLAKLFTIV